MAYRQPTKGNPEEKITMVSTDFSGGLNVMFSDDLVLPREMRYLENYDLDIRGEMRARKGFGRNTALSELINGANYVPFESVSEYMMVKLLENSNNTFRELSESDSLAQFQMTYGGTPQKLKLLFVVKLLDSTVRYYVLSFSITNSGTGFVGKTGILPVDTRNVENNLMSISHGEQYNRVFFTSNDKGMIMFSNEDDSFKYIGDFGVGFTNSAYKPYGLEIRRVGFNVLGDDPLTWIDNSTLTTESIQGIYLTTDSRVPVNVIPAGTKFHVNIIYTGNADDFAISFKEFDVPMEAKITKNTTLSSGGIAVYEVEFLTQPAEEVELKVIFSSVLVELEPYIDFYRVGDVPPDAKAIEQLNLGEFKMIQMFDRMVYYKGNIIWFSEINRFDYIPNFNFLPLPIDNTDEIVKIIYFRTSYIIFTKKRIYKLLGTFDSATFSLLLVNDDLGCVAPESVCLVENELFFVSTRGLRSLKSDVFRDNLENIREFDEKVYPLVTDHKLAYGFMYKDRYMLLSNYKSNKPVVTIGQRRYYIPDVLRYYYKVGTYAVDNFAVKPRFILFEQGQMYSFDENGFYKYETDYNDFGKEYNLVFETGGYHLGYPSHEKKIKHISFKLGGNVGLKQLIIDVFGDGYMVHSYEQDASIHPNPLDIESARFEINKYRLPTKCRNVAIRITTKSSFGMSLGTITYTYKLGKIRG